VNWAGVVTLLVSAVMAHYVLVSIIPIHAITTLAVSMTLYPLLRTTVLKPNDGSSTRPDAIADPITALDGRLAVSPHQVS